MSLIFLAGEKLNILEQAATVTPSPAADSLFPVTNLCAGTPQEPFQFSATASASTITTDLNIVLNSGLEDWTTGDPDNWEKEENGSSAVTEETSLVNGGSSAAKLTSVSNADVLIYQDLTCLAGWRVNLEAALRGDGSVPVRLRIRCLETGKYYTSGGSWTTTPTDYATRTTASYADTTVTLSLDDWEITLLHQVTLRLEFAVTETGVGYVDDVHAWPSWDFGSVHHHNIGANVTIQLRSSTDNFSSSDVLKATMTRARPTFFSSLGSYVDGRYARLKLDGANYAAIQIGELVLGQKRTVSKNPSFPYGQGFEMIQLEAHDMGSTPYRVNLSPDELRSFNLRFSHSASQRDDIQIQLCKRSNWGEKNVVLVPDTALTDVLLARAPRGLSSPRAALDRYPYEIVLVELPFPIVGL